MLESKNAGWQHRLKDQSEMTVEERADHSYNARKKINKDFEVKQFMLKQNPTKKKLSELGAGVH